MINKLQNRDKVLNLLGLATRAGKLITGTETVIMGLGKKKVKKVIVASDLQHHSLEKVQRAAKKANVGIIDLFTSQELQHAVGKERKVLALTDQGFAKALDKLISKGV